MRYALITVLAISSMLGPALPTAFAANDANQSSRAAAGAIADKFLDLHAHEAEALSQREKVPPKSFAVIKPQNDVDILQTKRTADEKKNNQREVEWQQKLDILSEKLRLARKAFTPTADGSIDLMSLPSP